MQPSRRNVITTTGALALTGITSTLTPRPLFAETLKPKILDTKVISWNKNLYHGWSTITRLKSGRIMLVYSGGRQAHVCPFGRVEQMHSDNNGISWTYPRTLYDGPIDDRDSGILETSNGSLLVSWFTSLAYEKNLDKRDPSWQAIHNRLTKEQREAELGQWIIRSTDGGQTWSKRINSLVNSPHGPIQLQNGDLLYPGKSLWTGGKVGVSISKDDGQTWQWHSDIPVRKNDYADDYHELHGIQTQSGKIIVQIRNHNTADARETLQCQSTDNGKTWTTPHSIGVWGLPSHLIQLNDGRLLMSYGYRRKPYGNQARISEDEGKTWSTPITISADGISGDLGYPSTVQLAYDSLLTVWYEKMRGSNHAQLRQAIWTL